MGLQTNAWQAALQHAGKHSKQLWERLGAQAPKPNHAICQRVELHASVREGVRAPTAMPSASASNCSCGRCRASTRRLP